MEGFELTEVLYKSKNAGLLSHTLASVAGHVIQNQIAKKTFASPLATDLYSHFYNAGLRGIDPSIKHQRLQGLMSSLIPEIGVLTSMSQNVGHHFSKGLAKTSLKSHTQLTPEHHRFINDLVSVNFKEAF